MTYMKGLSMFGLNLASSYPLSLVTLSWLGQHDGRNLEISAAQYGLVCHHCALTLLLLLLTVFGLPRQFLGFMEVPHLTFLSWMLTKFFLSTFLPECWPVKSLLLFPNFWNSVQRTLRSESLRILLFTTVEPLCLNTCCWGELFKHC